MNELIIKNKLNSLAKSKFRSSFYLKEKDILYIKKKGIQKISEDTLFFINQRLKNYNPENDGHQTPYRGHPAFVAMHATACCCRGCIEKWHHIDKKKILSSNEEEYLRDLIICWILEEIKNDYSR